GSVMTVSHISRQAEPARGVLNKIAKPDRLDSAMHNDLLCPYSHSMNSAFQKEGMPCVVFRQMRDCHPGVGFGRGDRIRTSYLTVPNPILTANVSTERAKKPENEGSSD